MEMAYLYSSDQPTVLSQSAMKQVWYKNFQIIFMWCGVVWYYLLWPHKTFQSSTLLWRHNTILDAQYSVHSQITQLLDFAQQFALQS